MPIVHRNIIANHKIVFNQIHPERVIAPPCGAWFGQKRSGPKRCWLMKRTQPTKRSENLRVPEI